MIIIQTPDGEPLRYYSPPPRLPPPPAPPPAPIPIQARQAQVAKDKGALNAAVHEQATNRSHTATFGSGPGGPLPDLTSEINALQAQLDADEQALRKAQTDEALTNYKKAQSHAPGAPDVRTATTQLQNSTLNEEVTAYEKAHGGYYADPGSAQWQQDAAKLLGDAGKPNPELDRLRARVVDGHLSEARANGLDPKAFGAQIWGGEAVGRAKLIEQPTGAAPTLDQKQQREQKAVGSLSDSLSSLNDPKRAGVDPQLARQALMANGYVPELAGRINQTMRDVSVSPNKTQSDGIGFLLSVVKDPGKIGGVDPQLAMVIVGTAAPTLQEYMRDQPNASNDQASQSYVNMGGLYYVLLVAQRAGVAGAGSLADQLAQWSYAAANGTDANRLYAFDSDLDKLLPEVQSKTKRDGIPPNLLYKWESMSQGHGAPVAEDSFWDDTDYGHAWGQFRSSLDGDAQLRARDLTTPQSLIPATPALTPDQISSTYGTALDGFRADQANGLLPADANPVELAGVQVEMGAGFGTADEVPLARAMIAGQQQQLAADWQQQNQGRPVLMPVNALTGQASSQVEGLGAEIGFNGPDWASAVQQGRDGLEAAATQAPSTTVIHNTNAAYRDLKKAEASGDPNAIAAARQKFNEAVWQEEQAVYGPRFSGTSLVSDYENANWHYLAQVQVLKDHAADPGIFKEVAVALPASEIIESSLGAGQPREIVHKIDVQLAPLQQPGATQLDPVTQAVQGDARVQGLVNGQVSLATAGQTAADGTTALKHEADVSGYYENADPGGVIGQQIITGIRNAPLTQQISANAHAAASGGKDVLGVAAPLMIAAKFSPSLTLAMYNSFDVNGTNVLVQAAGQVHSEADYRNLANIYAALPDDPGTGASPEQVTQARNAKAALIKSFGQQLNQAGNPDAQNLKSWIQSSFSGNGSAPVALAHDLTTGYPQGGDTKTVGKLTDQGTVSSIKDALSQHKDTDNSKSGPATSSSIDMTAAVNADGTTLQEFTSDSSLNSYVGQAYGLQPTSGSGPSAVYDPNTIVYGNTTLGQIVGDLKQQAGVQKLGEDTPIVLQATPIAVGEEQGSEFVVQQRDGSTVWVGPDGKVTAGWAEQDAALTHNSPTTVVQVVGGYSGIDANGDANPLLKIDIPAEPPPPQLPLWETLTKEALAITAGIAGTVLSGGNFLVGFGAAFAVQQLFDDVTNDGSVTVVKFGSDLITGKATWEEAKHLAVDSGTEVISAAADAWAPGAAQFVAGKVVDALAGSEFNAGMVVGGRVLTAPQRLLTAASASGAQQTIQAGANLANSVITLKANGQLNWNTYGQAADRQAVDLAFAIPTGGVSALLPANVVAQGVAGFGTGLAQAAVDDPLFEHHGLTRDDVISALVMTVPGTAQHYMERPNVGDSTAGAISPKVTTQPVAVSADDHSQPVRDLPDEAGSEPRATGEGLNAADGLPANFQGAPRSGSPADTKSEVVHVPRFKPEDFTTPDLAYTSDDPVRNANIRLFADWMANIANKFRVKLALALNANFDPQKTRAELEILYGQLVNARYRKQLAFGASNAAKFRTPIADGDPNIDPFGATPSDGVETMNYSRRVALGRIIAVRLEAAGTDSLINTIELPGLGSFRGNRLVRGDAAEQIDAAKGSKYGFDGPKYFTETAPPADQRRLHAASLSLLGNLIDRRSEWITADAAGRRAMVDQFSLGLYGLFHSPIYNRGSDSVIRLMGALIHERVFQSTVALPQDIDVTAYALDQHSFVRGLGNQLLRSRDSDFKSADTNRVVRVVGFSSPEPTIREQRLALDAQRAYLPFVHYQGEDWAVSGAHDDSIILRPVGRPDQVVTAHDLIGSPAESLDSKTKWRVESSNEPHSLSLVDDDTGETTVLNMSGNVRDWKPIVFVDDPRSKKRWSNAPSEYSGTEPTKWMAVGVDQDEKVEPRRILLQRVDVPPLEKKVPYASLNGPILVRFKGRESEGAFSLRYAQGQWIASRGKEEFPVSADEVVGDYQYFPSYAFGYMTISTVNRAVSDQRTRASPPTNGSYPDVETSLSDHKLGVVPDGQVTVKVAVGSKHHKAHVEFIQGLKPGTPLFIRQIMLKKGTPLAEAIIEHAKTIDPVTEIRAQVTLTISKGGLDQDKDFRKEFIAAGVKIKEPEGIVHQKSLSTPDELWIYTGPYVKTAKHFINDVGIYFTGDTAAQYFEFENLTTRGGVRFQVQDVLKPLAASGIAIDAPHEGVTDAPAAWWALARGAQDKIVIRAKEFIEPRFFALLVDKAKQGVKVKLFVAFKDGESFGQESEELWQKALQENPNLPLTLKVQSNVPRRRHFNAIFADDHSAVGTLYPWVTAFNKVEPPKGREHMVILGPADTKRLKRGINRLWTLPPRRYKPRHI